MTAKITILQFKFAIIIIPAPAVFGAKMFNAKLLKGIWYLNGCNNYNQIYQRQRPGRVQFAW